MCLTCNLNECNICVGESCASVENIWNPASGLSDSKRVILQLFPWLIEIQHHFPLQKGKFYAGGWRVNWFPLPTVEEASLGFICIFMSIYLIYKYVCSLILLWTSYNIWFSYWTELNKFFNTCSSDICINIIMLHF